MRTSIVVLFLTALACIAQVKEDGGVKIQGISYEGSSFFLAGGQKHAIFIFDSPTGSLATQYFHVNMTTGNSYSVNTGHDGRGNGTNRQVSTQNGHIYLHTSEPCYVYDYDLLGNISHVTKPGWGEYLCGSTGANPALNKNVTYCAEGSPGKIYCGTAVYGTAFEIDTATGVIRDYGQISTTSGYQYAMVEWADANYFWVVNRDANTNEYWLTSVKISDGTQTDCFNSPPSGEAYIYTRKVDGVPFYGHGDPYLLPTDGTCPTDTIAWPTTAQRYAPFEKVGNVWFSTVTAKADLLVDADLSQIYASATGKTSFSYRNPSGSGAWKTKVGSLTTGDVVMRRVVQSANTDTLFLVGAPYSASATASVATGLPSDVGTISTQSTYAVLWDGTHWYLSGYPSNTYRYDPTLPWTLSADTTLSNCTEASPVNPCLAKVGWGKYHNFSGVGSDGRIYVASNYDRQSRAGGDIGWYKSSDNSTGELGTAEMTCWLPDDFVSMNAAGTEFAYSGKAESGVGAFGCAETVGKIYIFDVATQAITATLTPIAGSVSPGKLLALASGRILGFVQNYPTAADYTIYSINPATDTLDWTVTGVGNLFNDVLTPDCRPVLGADGYAYFYIGNNLTRLHPATGAIETAYADSTAHGGMSLVTGPFGSAMYLWGSTHLYRINLWRPAALRVKNSHSTATQVRLKYGRTTTLDATAQTVACAYEAACYVAIPGHVIGDMYYQWEFLTAGNAITAASDITKVTLN